MKPWFGLSPLAVLVVLATAACDGDIQLAGSTAGDAGGPDATIGDAGVEAQADSPFGSDRPLGSCTDESGCGFDTLHCDLGRGVCVECRQDGDCRSGDRIVCDTSTGRCIGCRGDGDCTSEKRCEPTRHACVERCSSSRPCSVGTCDLAGERCVECVAGAACATGGLCAPTAVCVACTMDQHCAGEDNRCDVLLGRCVECTSHAHCSASERCDVKAGECKTPDN